MVNNNLKKKIHEIPRVECEFKFGKDALSKVIEEDGKSMEVIAFADVRGFTPRLIDDNIVFFDKNEKEVIFDDNNVVYKSDYEHNYKAHLSPIPSNKPSKYNSIGAIRLGFEDRMDGVNKVFEVIKAFSGYGFNLSHSIAYSVVSYKEAFLSYYYPIEFYYGVLRTYKAGTDDKIKNAMLTAKKRGITIAPPDINVSFEQFELFYNDEVVAGIVAGLSDIKNCGEKAAKPIIEERESKGDFVDFDDFIKRMKSKVNKTVINALIKAGCFDCFEKNRYKLLKYYNTKVNPYSKSSKPHIIGDFEFPTKGEILKDIFTNLDEDKYDRIAKIELEERLLSVPLSEHPLSSIKQKFLIDLDDYTVDDKVKFAGFLRGFTKRDTRTGKKYGIFNVELASSLIIECKMWDIDSVRAKVPPRLTSQNRAFEENTTLKDVQQKLNMYKAKGLAGIFNEEDCEEYERLFKSFVYKEALTEGRTYKPLMFEGKIQEYRGERSVILSSVSEIKSKLTKGAIKEKKHSTSSKVDEEVVEIDDIIF